MLDIVDLYPAPLLVLLFITSNAVFIYGLIKKKGGMLLKE